MTPVPRRAPPRIVIEPARHADLPRLVAMVAAADDAERALLPDLVIRRPDRAHARRSFKRTLASQGSRMLVARCCRAGGRTAAGVIGMIGIDLHRARHRYVVVRRHAYVHTLFVEPAFRGLRVARRLVRRALRVAERAGAQQVRLEMAAANRAARRVYEERGFRVREMMFTLDLQPIR
jgi:ribosomal protein S18 acetylase RimI-like enzyme